jgi:hypothetical protein
MRSIAEARLPIALFVGLLAISVGLKGALGPQLKEPSAAVPGLVENQLAHDLQSQGFSIRREVSAWQSTAILATRGDCRLSVRDASHGAFDRVVYARDAAHVGQLRYLFAGRRYESPPTVVILMGRIAAKVVDRLGIRASVPIAVALATSPACADDDFGLRDIRAPV